MTLSRHATLASLLFSAFAATAFAQTPAQRPKAPEKPAVTRPTTTTPKAQEAAATGAMTLLCRDPGQSSPAGTASNQSALVYERITIKDAAGAPKTFYAPVSATITNGFTPAATIVTGRGESLGPSSCGLTAAVIAPVPGSPSLKLILADAPSISLSTSASRGVNGAFASHEPRVLLPPCASGVRRFNVQRTSPSEFFVSLATPGATACVD